MGFHVLTEKLRQFSEKTKHHRGRALVVDHHAKIRERKSVEIKKIQFKHYQNRQNDPHSSTSSHVNNPLPRFYA